MTRKKKNERKRQKSPFEQAAAAMISRRKQESMMEQAKIFNSKRLRKFKNLSPDNTDRFEKEQEIIKLSSQNINNLLKQIEIQKIDSYKEVISPNPLDIQPQTDEKMNEQIKPQMQKAMTEIDDYKRKVLDKQRKLWGID